ncbi:thiamine phosphate synthase [Jonesia quinghaiensis]|uniref:thiamine phosphate synthase n=1 Tax=Jonesia quinghaiensis TaxID=262806 RepID=UPI00040D1971|nr:thiamine phosphate synthase [Jonesia quinghaiensis]
MTLIAQLPTPGGLRELPDLSVYLIVDEGLCHTQGRTVTDTVAQAVAGGVSCIQVRAKQADARSFFSLIAQVCSVVGDTVPVIINDRVDLYLAARTEGMPVAGVHVGQRDLPVSVVRRMVGPQAILGLSASTEQHIACACADAAGVDYVGVGALHPTSTKHDAPPALGLSGLQERVGFSAVPVVAIGGINTSDLPALRGMGVAGAAVASAICGAPDVTTAARALRAAWDTGIVTAENNLGEGRA